MFTATIGKNGQMLQLPLEVNEKLRLKENDWFQACIKPEHIALIHSGSEVDEELLEALIHEGILIDANDKVLFSPPLAKRFY